MIIRILILMLLLFTSRAEAQFFSGGGGGVGGSGSGIANRYAKFSNTTTITPALLSDDGVNVSYAQGFLVGGLNVNSFLISNTGNINPVGGGTSLLGNSSSSWGGIFFTNCSSSASPAVCTSASAGSVVVAASATTVVVNTTAVTANSQIFLMYDSSLGAKLSVTCNTTIPALYGVTARTAGTSFTITATAPTTNPACFSYFIVN